MIFSRFESVRSRLLAVMVLILVPIAIISMVLATTTYRSVYQGLETAQVEVGSNYAVRVRVWFRGVLRMVVATSGALRQDALGAEGSAARCSLSAGNALAGTQGVQAMLVAFPGVFCVASILPQLDEGVLQAMLAEQARRPKIRLWGGTELGETRYDVVEVGRQKHLVVFVRSPEGFEAVVIVDPGLLDVALDIGSLEAGSIVALVRRGGKVIVSRGADESDSSWLPADERFSAAITRAMDVDGLGGRHAFVSQTVAEPDLYVLARFDNSAANAAFTQFLVLAFTPLMMLAVLFGAYAWAIEGNVLRWLKAIDLAARARREGRSEKVVLADAMPSDVALLAASFNDMVSDADSRELALRASFEANQFLMRELHHRVKNSLQVIQSYLALSRRLHKRNSDRHIIETEAKVQVLSTAYRLALMEGTMRPVPLSAFMQEIVGNLSTSLRRSNQWIDFQIRTSAGLVVDRTIPIGLALVEAISAGLAAEDSHMLRVIIEDCDDGGIIMTVSTDGTLEPGMPPPKIMAGLALQIGATVQSVTTGKIVDWRFSP